MMPPLDDTADADGVPEAIHPDPIFPPWGASALQEYDEIIRRLGELSEQDRPGIPKSDRERLAAEKDAAYEARAIYRAQAVDDFLRLLRWSSEEQPSVLGSILSSALDLAGLHDDIDVVADAILDLRNRRAS